MKRTSRTSAQRYNTRMHGIFERSKELKSKHAPINALQVLSRMTIKLDKVISTNLKEKCVSEEDWSDLRALTREARGILEYAKDQIVD